MSKGQFRVYTITYNDVQEHWDKLRVMMGGDEVLKSFREDTEITITVDMNEGEELALAEVMSNIDWDALSPTRQVTKIVGEVEITYTEHYSESEVADGVYTTYYTEEDQRMNLEAIREAYRNELV